MDMACWVPGDVSIKLGNETEKLLWFTISKKRQELESRKFSS